MPNPLDQLRLLTENENTAISSTAKKALQYTAELDAGNLDKEEYQDLLEDLATTRAVAELADELSTKQLLASALQGAIAIAV
jgi:hypothetical protein